MSPVHPPHSTRVQHCLDKAAHCERQVAATTTIRIKAAFADAAAQWRELAEQIERLERTGGGLED
jgi:hypothetical protein